MSASTVGRVGMLLRIGRHRHFEIAMRALDAGDQIGGIAVAARMRRILRARPAGRIAAQRHDVAHAGVVIIAHDGIDVLARRCDAGQMRGRRQRRLRENALDRRVRALARRAAGAVGDRDEIRRQRRQPLDRLPQDLFHLRRLRREEFERHLDAAALAAGETAGAARSSRHLPLRRLPPCSARASRASHSDTAILPSDRAPATGSCAAPARARTPSSIASRSPAQSRAGDARTARAGIPARAARSPPPGAARPGAARARLL